MTDKASAAILKLILDKNGTASLTVKGNSMLPALNEGDEISVKKEDDYHVGDIIVFDYPGEGLLIHRIISIDDGIYICKGDNAIRKEPVMKRKIIGKAVL